MRFKIILLCVSLFLTTKNYKTENINKERIKIVTISPSYIQPGETLIVWFKGKISNKKIKAEFNNRNLPILKVGKKIFTVIALDIKNPSGIYPFVIYLKNKNRNFKEIYKKEIEVKKSKRIEVDFGKEPKRSQEFLRKYWKERKILKKVIKTTAKTPYFSKSFIMPLKKIKITGEFGAKRKYKNGRIRVHRGIDLKAPFSTKVYAINSGKVILTKKFTFEGNFLVIDHGGGIVSFYMHLSQFKVRKGNFVKRGQIIALSGNSGNSRSPHLHFAIKINNNTINPLKFIETINQIIN